MTSEGRTLPSGEEQIGVVVDVVTGEQRGIVTGRTPSPDECAGCGHIAKHHSRRDSVYAGFMADYRVVWRCAWDGCGCPEYVKAKP